MIKDGLAGLVVDGRAFAFPESVPNAEAAGENAAEVSIVIYEHYAQSFPGGAHGHGDTAGGGLVNAEIGFFCMEG